MLAEIGFCKDILGTPREGLTDPQSIVLLTKISSNISSRDCMSTFTEHFALKISLCFRFCNLTGRASHLAFVALFASCRVSYHFRLSDTGWTEEEIEQGGKSSGFGGGGFGGVSEDDIYAQLFGQMRGGGGGGYQRREYSYF